MNLHNLILSVPLVAGVAGFEPTNAGIKIRCLNHLATPQYVGKKNKWGGQRGSNSRPPGPQSGALTNWAMPAIYLVRLKRFELLTHGLEGRCSIQLSYRRISKRAQEFGGAGDGNRTHAASLEGWNSTIELHPHSSHFTVVSTTLVYNSIKKRNCQIFFTPFYKKIKKIYLFLL